MELCDARVCGEALVSLRPWHLSCDAHTQHTPVIDGLLPSASFVPSDEEEDYRLGMLCGLRHGEQAMPFIYQTRINNIPSSTKSEIPSD